MSFFPPPTFFCGGRGGGGRKVVVDIFSSSLANRCMSCAFHDKCVKLYMH